MHHDTCGFALNLHKITFTLESAVILENEDIFTHRHPTQKQNMKGNWSRSINKVEYTKPMRKLSVSNRLTIERATEV